MWKYLIKGCFCSFRSPIPSFHFQEPARRTYQLPGLLRSTPFILKDTTVRIVFVAGFFFIRREKRYAAPDVSCYQLVHFLSLRYEKAAQCNAIRLDACLTGISSRFKLKKHGQLVDFIRIRPHFWFQCSNGLFLHDTGRILLRSITFR